MFPGNCSLMAALFRAVFVLLLPSVPQSCGKGTVGISESLVLGSALSLALHVEGRAGDIFSVTQHAQPMVHHVPFHSGVLVLALLSFPPGSPTLTHCSQICAAPMVLPDLFPLPFLSQLSLMSVTGVASPSQRS